MNRILNLNFQASAELVACLVASQLEMRQKTGQWLKATQLVKSARLWSRLNGRHADWRQRVTPACRARHLAERLKRTPQQTCDARTLARRYFGGVRLDLRSKAVSEILVTSAANSPRDIVLHGEGCW
ncbi:hypothetical protein E2553_42310 [Paraburkholderia dipogonis]|uniref:Uncharacterized protein n=1 Tax=Paraburkholderia dipogonis TaxID=1211383 RepID=A0A4Y8MG80_9BURK|nr:hypothetical protein E2553_42310 [Paraburkholderia dipogonis]